MKSLFLLASESLIVVSKSGIAERLSSPMFSQGMSNTSSRVDRISSKPDQLSSSPLHYYHVTPEGSSHSSNKESRQKEEMSVVRSLAEVHCVLAEVSV